jgi:pimeloyl-ACP methyl ester carboxylesterase
MPADRMAFTFLYKAGAYRDNYVVTFRGKVNRRQNEEDMQIMDEFVRAPEVMDRPEILERLFFPRRELPGEASRGNGMPHAIKVAEGISIGCRFYPAKRGAPSILYFHGNGEIAADYDYVAPLYQERGINLFVADYRGYGRSDGNPGCAALIADSHPLFEGFVAVLQDQGYRGDLFVMGRSLGSAPAIEVAYHYQDQLEGLIVESGFASQQNQLARSVRAAFSRIRKRS